MTSDLLGVGIAIVGTTVLGMRSLWVANEASESQTKTNARLNDAIRSINKRFNTQSDRINSIETEMQSDYEDAAPEPSSPPTQGDGPYRTSSNRPSEDDSPTEIAKAFVSGQKVDVAFRDDEEPEHKPLLRFSAVFVRFSKDEKGQTQVWLKCDEGEPEPYRLADIDLRHPGEAR